MGEGEWMGEGQRGGVIGVWTDACEAIHVCLYESMGDLRGEGVVCARVVFEQRRRSEGGMSEE